MILDRNVSPSFEKRRLGCIRATCIHMISCACTHVPMYQDEKLRKVRPQQVGGRCCPDMYMYMHLHIYIYIYIYIYTKAHTYINIYIPHARTHMVTFKILGHMYGILSIMTWITCTCAHMHICICIPYLSIWLSMHTHNYKHIPLLTCICPHTSINHHMHMPTHEHQSSHAYAHTRASIITFTCPHTSITECKWLRIPGFSNLHTCAHECADGAVTGTAASAMSGSRTAPSSLHMTGLYVCMYVYQ
jgi:hypothetical protein